MGWIRTRKKTVVVLSAIILGAGILNWLPQNSNSSIQQTAHASNSPSKAAAPNIVKVDVTKPHPGGLDRTTVLPGSIHPYEAAELYAKVSGYLQKQTVDIGDRVTAGQLLVELDAPELHRDVDRSKAALDRATAQVGQMQARIVAAEADQHAAETGITRAQAGIKRDQAAFDFRDKQYRRFHELVQSRSVDERLVDEKEEQRLAARAAVDASEATLSESKALVSSAKAKVAQARADLVDAEAEVEVAQANLAKAQVFANYTRVTAPYDGIITFRAFHRGDFIRAADQSGGQPLLTVERTDIVRLVVHVPDNDVPYTNPGDETITDIDALPGHKFAAKISRIAYSEDKKSKTMRTEVDLPNDKGLLRNGMYGRTKLMLQPGNPAAFTVPSSALSGSTKDGKGLLFVVKDGKAHKVPVTISADNGVQAEIIEGLNPTDLVIVGNNNSIIEGQPVEVHELSAIEPTKR